MFFIGLHLFRYVWSGLVVLLGIFLNVYSKNQAKINMGISDGIRQLVVFFQKVNNKPQHSTMDV